MTKELSDHGQSLAGCYGSPCKGVTQVVDPDFLDPCAGSDTLPEGLLVAERLAGQGAGDNPRIAVDACCTVHVLDYRGTKMQHFFAGFGFGQAQGSLVEIDAVTKAAHLSEFNDEHQGILRHRTELSELPRFRHR